MVISLIKRRSRLYPKSKGEPGRLLSLQEAEAGARAHLNQRVTTSRGQGWRNLGLP